MEIALLNRPGFRGGYLISISAAKVQEFNENMVHFYYSKDASRMMAFLAACHSEI